MKFKIGDKLKHNALGPNWDITVIKIDYRNDRIWLNLFCKENNMLYPSYEYNLNDKGWELLKSKSITHLPDFL